MFELTEFKIFQPLYKYNYDFWIDLLSMRFNKGS